MTPIDIKVASDVDEDQAIAVAVQAFSTDPLMRWAMPDPHQFLEVFPAYLRAVAGRAFDHRSAYYIDGFRGSAFWLPPGISFDEEAAIDVLQRNVAPDRLEEILALMERVGKYHPTQPHWYLPFMAVEARFQRKGLGSSLMRHALMPCDHDGTLAYLEASSRENLALYERHGFEVLATVQCGTCPPLFPMVRKPR